MLRPVVARENERKNKSETKTLKTYCLHHFLSCEFGLFLELFDIVTRPFYYKTKTYP